MSLLYFNKERGIALSSDPLALAFDRDSTDDICPDFVVVDELTPYFIRSFDHENDDWLGQTRFLENRTRIFPGGVRELSFLNRVGLTRIGPINLRVASRKMSEERYRSMLDFISVKFANLIFSFEGRAGVNYRKARPGSDIPYIEFLFLDRFLLGNPPLIDTVSGLILSDPHRKLNRYKLYKPPELVAHGGPSMVEKIAEVAGHLVKLRPGQSVATTSLAKILSGKAGMLCFPGEVHCEERRHTLDTPENRFIKFVLQRLARTVSALNRDLRGKNGGYLNQGIEDRLAELSKKLSLFLSAALWKEVGGMTHIPANSQVLQKRNGYRQLFYIYSLLQLLTECEFVSEDFQHILETKDIATLYEYWCFFVVHDVLSARARVRSSRTFISSNSTDQNIVGGLEITYTNGTVFTFQKNCPAPFESYSHSLTPDMVLAIGETALVLDAKFKGELKSDAIESHKMEDIDKMHAYRDALKNVCGAFILYPGSKHQSEIYRVSYDANDFDGVGALCLNPDETGGPNAVDKTNLTAIVQSFLEKV